jgi:hypothetical protein
LREEAICAGLRRAAETGGETAEAAELLESILRPHLAKERIDVLEPLGLLARLAAGEVCPGMAEVLPQIEQLANDRHGLRVEHATILSAIKRLVAAAREEGKSQPARFAERLLFRAWLDESIFSPLAILIGKYLELRLHPELAFADAASSLGKPIGFDLPESLRLNHAQLNAALSAAMQAGGQTMIAAKALAPLLESHLQREDKEVLPILGLLEALATEDIDPARVGDYAGLESLKTNVASLREEQAALSVAAEKLLAIARAEGNDEVIEFAERLLSRIALDEGIFYSAALLIRDYLRLKRRRQPSSEVSSLEIEHENRN